MPPCIRSQAADQKIESRSGKGFLGVFAGDWSNHDVRDRASVPVLSSLPLQGTAPCRWRPHGSQPESNEHACFLGLFTAVANFPGVSHRGRKDDDVFFSSSIASSPYCCSFEKTQHVVSWSGKRLFSGALNAVGIDHCEGPRDLRGHSG